MSKTLQEIKDEVGRELFFDNWSEVYASSTFTKVDSMLDIIVERYATECIKASDLKLINDIQEKLMQNWYKKSAEDIYDELEKIKESL